MNQARFAVLASRRPSLTHPATRGSISGVRLFSEQFRIPSHACFVTFYERHKADPAQTIPTFRRGWLCPRSKRRRSCGPAQPLSFAPRDEPRAAWRLPTLALPTGYRQRGRSLASLNFRLCVMAAITAFLNRWAFNVAIRTIDAAISVKRLEDYTATFAIIEILASIRRHSVL